MIIIEQTTIAMPVIHTTGSPRAESGVTRRWRGLAGEGAGLAGLLDIETINSWGRGN
jgi:hypothetical protein